MTEKVKEYIASLRGKKIAFVGMGVANAPSALFWLAMACRCMPVTVGTRAILEKRLVRSCEPAVCSSP